MNIEPTPPHLMTTNERLNEVAKILLMGIKRTHKMREENNTIQARSIRHRSIEIEEERGIKFKNSLYD